MKFTKISMQNNEGKNLLLLVKCELNDESFKKILINNSNLLSIEFDNPEIIARINDLKFISNVRDKINYIKIAIENYFIVYKENNEIQYLIRAFELINKVKHLYKDNFSNFELEAKKAFLKLNNSFYQLKLINTISFLLRDISTKLLIDYSIKTLRLKYEEVNFNDA